MVRGYTTSGLLLSRLADDDDLAWSEFCGRYGELIRGFAGRWGFQSADCDDIVQDVLTEFTKVMPGFAYDRERGRFRGFLKTLTTRVIVHRLRRRPLGEAGMRGDAALDDAATPDTVEAHWDREWRRHHVRQAMRRLEAEFNESTRLAFQRYAVDGATVQATAEQFDLSIDQVYQAKSRVLRRLGELVAEQVADEG